jgi:hypothetical protein
MKVVVDGTKVFLSRTAIKQWNERRGGNIERELMGSHFGAMPSYVHGRGTRLGVLRALIVDSQGCFMVKMKGRSSGTAVAFCHPPPDDRLRRGFRHVD